MSDSEFSAVLDLLAMLFFSWRICILAFLLTAAAVYDYRFQRIPNWLVLSGALFGVIYNTVLPPSPHDTILFPLTGLGLGLLLFLPLYLIHAMGAGDVKLLAMVGAILGPGDTFRAALATMIVGGVLAILFVLVRGKALRMLQNLVSLFQLGFLSVARGSKPDLQIEAGMSAGRLPYGVPIALGTIGYLVLRQLGFL
ncbi:Prepilin peptidase CpaA [Georgfuchsia toluolica]|uniref:Prepilin peptidase CpaA n=1 Tax=Georgfuchsia toluolica TaxID=424218 RepID=A0A916N8R3_9PROT|nr:A24 family peptidase [Georgfuchsia toluolica]CAG4882908.1 Prepilin peptidase CpaA [Georgfuchsia toluolica]